MRKLLSLLTLALLVPAAVLALDYSDATSKYTDAPFGKAESAAISVLTNLGVVQGNPDGTFSSYRQVNRAEMSKLALVTAKDFHPDSALSGTYHCFPDVTASDWFAPYVCGLKQMDVVQGYGDSHFHPEQPVTLAEAVKIAVVLWDIPLPQYVRAPDHWYDPYLTAARSRGILLDDLGSPERPLTRGRAARLIAAFRAFADGDLDNYRRAERGLPPLSSSSSSVSSSSSISSSSSSVSSSISSVSSASSESSASSVVGFPARSQFLIAGVRSQPVASATFFANLEPVFIQHAEVKLENKIDGIDAMFVIGSSGRELGQIYLDKNFDSTEKTWRGNFSVASGSYEIPKSEQRTLGVELRMKTRDQGGTSEEMVQVHSFILTAEGEWSGASYTSGSDAGPFPKNQTAMGHIVSVANAGNATGVLPLGPKSILGEFSIGGYAVNGVTLRVEHLAFQISSSSFVTVNNWQLGIPNSDERLPCSFDSSASMVNCLNIPDTLGTINSGTQKFELYGDTSLQSGATDKTLQVSLNLAGSLSEIGAVRWTDGSGHFNWVELDQPLARGTSWK